MTSNDDADIPGVDVTRFPVHGIDVSKYQGAIDWPAAARGGVRFAWIKATEGGDHAGLRLAPGAVVRRTTSLLFTGLMKI